MAVGYVDLGPVIHSINSMESAISSKINSLHNDVDRVNNHVVYVQQQVDQNQQELVYLKRELLNMRLEQKKMAALQRAITEIIRVRQELEQKFGTQKQVRDSMLGILQANDLGLITKSTISQCTEQLMISAPKYWLAPALVALAAWISDNKSLADRAIKESMKRDEEKTCLLFSLITRRVNAGRIAEGKEGTNVCFLWLSRYFAKQNPFKMKRSIVSYVDSYTSGIFGVDKDNVCSDQINNWLNTIVSSNPEFEVEQNEYWKNFFFRCADLQNPDSKEFRALELLSPQYNDMINYIKCIMASEDSSSNRGIKSYIDKIKNDVVDKEALVKDIDDQLYYLVSNFEEDEAPLRYEEKYLTYVKEYGGDEEKAKKRLDLEEEKRRDEPVDFVARLREAIIQPNAKASAKKTALAMMRGYIKNAFEDFIVEYKDKYPESIDLLINDPGKVVKAQKFSWEGKTDTCDNKEELIASLEKMYETQRENALGMIDDEKPKKYKIAGIILTCLVVTFFIGIPLLCKAKRLRLNNESNRNQINKYFDSHKAQSVELLTNALAARKLSNELVDMFSKDSTSETINL